MSHCCRKNHKIYFNKLVNSVWIFIDVVKGIYYYEGIKTLYHNALIFKMF